MKAMQACLNGIPIVSPSWIDLCLLKEKIVLPDANMYVRTLPTKTTIANSASSEFGVAFLAAAADFSKDYSSTYAPMRNLNVYLVGFSCSNETSFGSLLRQAGANEVIVNKQTALSKVKDLRNADDAAKLVIMCNDTNVSITDALEREVRNHHTKVIVVNSQWLVDSISCGVALNPAEPYRPQSAKAKELWELTKAVKMT